ATRRAFCGGKTAQTLGSLPPKSRFSPAVFLQPRSGLLGCSEGLYLEERQNAKRMFRPEHCVWFSILPRRTCNLLVPHEGHTVQEGLNRTHVIANVDPIRSLWVCCCVSETNANAEALGLSAPVIR